MKKLVEGKSSEASTSNNDGAVNSHHGSLQTQHRRTSLYNRAMLKLRKLLKFLLFKEDEPKHGIWTDFNPVHLALVLPFSIAPAVGLACIGYLIGGVIGFFAAYIVASVLVIEIPHCIFDR